MLRSQSNQFDLSVRRFLYLKLRSKGSSLLVLRSMPKFLRCLSERLCPYCGESERR